MASGKPIASVKARLNQLESATASKQHLSKHPEQLRKQQVPKRKGSAVHSDEEDDSFAFADFIRALTAIKDRGTDVSARDALLHTFNLLDCDGDGYITLSDLRETLQDEDMEEEDMVEMIAVADDRGHGRISFDNFVRILKPALDEKKLQQVHSRKSD